ncbi:ABC transporter permease [Shimia thalassica]|uniref:ABC transporter permease n=1 Tax=Shimia thalassica TaxID=1715693 RepID=UPI0027339358|nr:ABC transporter permease [Shimia thalassica]MDP2517923.1 ABC transporter permease [Shimia thalassica]
MKRVFDSQLIGPFAAMVIVALVVAATTDRFLNPGNLSNLSLQVSIVALIAIGSTIVIIAAGIDLSAGSMVALLTMILAQFLKMAGIPLLFAVPLILVVGGLLGLVLGMITAYGRIPSFITTLAALIAFRGLALTFNNGSPIFSLDPALEPLFYGKVAGIPMPFFYLVFFYALAAFTMNFTKLGREIYAVGGNPAAAVLTGINVRKVQTLTFVIAGFMTAVGAVLMSARLNSGSPNYGQTLELQAIAAAVVGGASLAGGRGNILATLMGAMTIVIVQNGLNLNAAPSSVQNIVLGAIILLAVGIDMWRAEISSILGRLFGRPDKTVKTASPAKTALSKDA